MHTARTAGYATTVLGHTRTRQLTHLIHRCLKFGKGFLALRCNLKLDGLWFYSKCPTRRKGWIRTQIVRCNLNNNWSITNNDFNLGNLNANLHFNLIHVVFQAFSFASRASWSFFSKQSAKWPLQRWREWWQRLLRRLFQMAKRQTSQRRSWGNRLRTWRDL